MELFVSKNTTYLASFDNCSNPHYVKDHLTTVSKKRQQSIITLTHNKDK